MASELPGFFRDPKTGKYFKDCLNTPESIQNLEMEYLQHTHKQSKPQNILNLLKSREEGPMSGLHTIRKYYEVKMARKWTKISNDIDSSSSFTIENVEFIKGGENAIYGLWSITDPDDQYVIGEIPQMNAHRDNNTFLGLQASNKYVQDICHVFSNTLLYIYNDIQGLGVMDLLWKEGTRSLIYEHFHSRRWPLYCCTDQFDQLHHLAVGGLNTISLYSGISHVADYPVSGNVFTITFDETTNHIISGHSNGFLYMHDIRESNPQCFCIPVEVGRDRCLVDSQFLSPNQVVITGVSNKIYTIDLRLLRPVNYFIGHTHSVKKRPMSIANNMLCLTGADNVIRIWHLSGGLPIHEMRPTVPESNIRGWLGGDADKTYLYYFEGGIKKVYQI